MCCEKYNAREMTPGITAEVHEFRVSGASDGLLEDIQTMVGGRDAPRMGRAALLDYWNVLINIRKLLHVTTLERKVHCSIEFFFLTISLHPH